MTAQLPAIVSKVRKALEDTTEVSMGKLQGIVEKIDGEVKG